MPSTLFSCPCRDYTETRKQLEKIIHKQCAGLRHEHVDLTFVFLGSGGLYHEMKLLESLYAKQGVSLPTRVILIDPIYRTKHNLTPDFTSALWEFTDRLSQLSQSKQSPLRITVLKNLDEIWPIEPFINFIIIGIDPGNSIRPDNLSYFPELYRSMRALSRLQEYSKYQVYLAKSSSIYDKRFLMPVLSKLPSKYKKNPSVDYKVNIHHCCEKPLCFTYSSLSRRHQHEDTDLPLSQVRPNP